MSDNHCIMCGAVIPEGRLVCPICEAIVSEEPSRLPYILPGGICQEKEGINHEQRAHQETDE